MDPGTFIEASLPTLKPYIGLVETSLRPQTVLLQTLALLLDDVQLLAVSTSLPMEGPRVEYVGLTTLKKGSCRLFGGFLIRFYKVYITA